MEAVAAVVSWLFFLLLMSSPALIIARRFRQNEADGLRTCPRCSKISKVCRTACWSCGYKFLFATMPKLRPFILGSLAYFSLLGVLAIFLIVFFIVHRRWEKAHMHFSFSLAESLIGPGLATWLMTGVIVAYYRAYKKRTPIAVLALQVAGLLLMSIIALFVAY
jgi:hypothetical protein